MKIEVLGKGCKNCLLLEENVKKALEELGQQADVEHVTDINKITERGVLMTPALIIDGEIKSEGKVASPDEIKVLLS